MPLNVTFTDASTGFITNRLWDSGDGTSTNTAATSFAKTYLVAGNYSVSLIVVGPGGTNSQSRLSGADDVVNVVARRPNGGLLIGGRFTMVNGELRERVALLYGAEQNSAPAIIVPPASQVANQGASVVFRVVTAGSKPMEYQWLKGESPILGATNSGLFLTNIQTTDAGSYAVALQFNDPMSQNNTSRFYRVREP